MVFGENSKADLDDAVQASGFMFDLKGVQRTRIQEEIPKAISWV